MAIIRILYDALISKGSCTYVTWSQELMLTLWMCVCLWVSGSGTLCASWQCLEVPRGPPPSLAVQFVGSGASLAGLDVELVGSRYRMSLVKKRFATGGSQAYFLFLKSSSFENSFFSRIPCYQVVARMFSRWLLSGLIQK